MTQHLPGTLCGRTAGVIAASRSRQPQSIPGASIMSTRGLARRTSSCLPNCSRDGGSPQPVSQKRKSIGLSRWQGCSKDATPTVKKVIMVCGDLDTHTKIAFYEAFEPARARPLGSRFSFRPLSGGFLKPLALQMLADFLSQALLTGKRFQTATS